MEIEVIKSFILTGCKYQYTSFDYKKAYSEFKEDYEKAGSSLLYKPNSWDIPIEYKLKYKVMRIGKLRRIGFNPNGELNWFLIGNKFNKRFYCKDFGTEVKPILNICDDKFGLIKSNEAILWT
jgi:hypothetical protein